MASPVVRWFQPATSEQVLWGAAVAVRKMTAQAGSEEAALQKLGTAAAAVGSRETKTMTMALVPVASYQPG
jgi:hypothetical protein